MSKTAISSKNKDLNYYTHVHVPNSQRVHNNPHVDKDNKTHNSSVFHDKNNFYTPKTKGSTLKLKFDKYDGPIHGLVFQKIVDVNQYVTKVKIKIKSKKITTYLTYENDIAILLFKHVYTKVKQIIIEPLEHNVNGWISFRVEAIKKNLFKVLNVPENKRTYFQSYDDNKTDKLFSNSQLFSPTAWVGLTTGTASITIDVNELNYNGILFKERYDTYNNVHRVNTVKLQETNVHGEMKESTVTLKWKNGEAFHPLIKGMNEIKIIPKEYDGMYGMGIPSDLDKFVGNPVSLKTLNQK